MQKILFTAALLFAAVALSVACKKDKKSEPGPTPVQVVETGFAKGADISWVTEMEAAGKKFYNAAGVEMDAFALMKSYSPNIEW